MAITVIKKTQSFKIEDPNHAEMLEWVKEIAESSRYSYGTRRMQKALNALCFSVTRGKAKKLMDEAGVKVRSRKKFKVTTNSDHKQPVFDNVLDREFDVNEQDMAYVQDITYIWTQEGWLYLAVVIDLFSRKIVGWSMGSRMKAQLVCDALNMAVWQRKPRPGLIVHSDRGSQYASKVYRQLLKQYGIVGSMSRLGNYWDNAVAESFFRSLNKRWFSGVITKHAMKRSRILWNTFRCFITQSGFIHIWITRVQMSLRKKSLN